MDLYLATNCLLPLWQVNERSPGMCQLAIHTHNIKSSSNILIAPREILEWPSLQSQKCKLLESIPKICVSTMSFSCPRGFLYSPFFWGYNYTLNTFYDIFAPGTSLGPHHPWRNLTFGLTQSWKYECTILIYLAKYSYFHLLVNYEPSQCCYVELGVAPN
jgi:hypothetical protein